MSAQWKINTKIGTLYLVASNKGVQGLFWKKQSAKTLTSLEDKSASSKILKQAAQELQQYLEGKRKKFDVALDVVGTDFQKAVWKELLKIPYGKTYSYKDLAVKIKKDKAVRAVGSANARNPLCIFIPCHRIIASNGNLGGYSGGLAVKEQLIQLEQDTN